MSFSCFGEVWGQSSHKGTTLLVQLAIADAMNDYLRVEIPMIRLRNQARATDDELRQAFQELEQAGDIRIIAELPASAPNGYPSVIVDFIPRRIKQNQVVPPPPPREPPDQSYLEQIRGYVYLLRCGQYFKIGQSVAVSKRMKRLAIQLPHKPELIHVIATDDHEALEEELKAYFAEVRLNGEWFALTDIHIHEFQHYGCNGSVKDERRRSHLYLDGQGMYVPDEFFPE